MTRRPSTVTSSVTRFGLAGLVAMLALGGLILVAVSRISTSEALRSARERAELAGHGVVEPALDDALLIKMKGSRQASRALDTLVQSRVLSERVVRVKVWSADGRILYSDEPQLIGRQFAAKPDHARAIQSGVTKAELADTSSPENRFERATGQLLEVYLPVRTPNGTPVVYEQYERYDSVVGNSRSLLRRLALPLGAGIALLWLTQLPLARSLARRVRSAEAERAELLERAVTASERERERIAADLHDGVVQDLAGLSYELAAATATAPDGDLRETLDRSTRIARSSMQRLRSSLVDLHPPTVHALGLAAAIDTLADPLRAAGTNVIIDIDVTNLPAEQESLLYRVVQELLRNVHEHAGATRASVKGSVSSTGVRLTVEDDGAGFTDAQRAERGSGGHVGLDLQQALVKRVGGSLRLTSSTGGGTLAVVELPR